MAGGCLDFSHFKAGKIKSSSYVDAVCFHTQIWLISECSAPSTPSPEDYPVSRDHLLAGCTIVKG